jgi:hypothetical protein
MYKKKTKDILNRVIDSFIMDSRFGPKTPKPQNPKTPKTPKPQNPKTPKPQNPNIIIKHK